MTTVACRVCDSSIWACRSVTYTTAPEDIFDFYDRPTPDEMEALEPHKFEAAREAGRIYLESRLSGKTDDIAAVYAFQKNSDQISKEGIAQCFGWDPKKPIVAIYSSNWFDWPHQFGMTNFVDFHDWIVSTYEVAKANTDVNWLFKPHPAEELFGGEKLAKMLGQFDFPDHIALSHEGWSSQSVLHAVDALITYHGTSGPEFASLGKPVLIPDVGSYHACGFVRVASSREDYLSLLTQPWWEGVDHQDVKTKAELFCGLWFCLPSTNEKFVIPDDSLQDELYTTLPKLLTENRSVIDAEAALIREWFDTHHPYYHTYKMLHSDAYINTALNA